MLKNNNLCKFVVEFKLQSEFSPTQRMLLFNK